MKHKSHKYRQDMRYGIRTFESPEEAGMRLGQPINKMRMNDLEAEYEIMFKKLPKPPRGYKSRRGHGNNSSPRRTTPSV